MCEISDFFRHTFNNDWPEFVVCTDCDSTLPQGMKISAKDVFGEENSISLERMDSLTQLPDCPNCAQAMEIFHDSGRTLELTKGRLSTDGYLSLLRDADSDQVEGICYGYRCLLAEQFKSEWANKYNYMARRNPKHDRSLDDLITCLNEAIPDAGLSANTEV